MSGDGIQKFLDGLPMDVSLAFADHKRPTPKVGETPSEIVVVLAFSEPSFGFGEFTIKQTSEGIFVDTEASGPERIKKYLSYLIDNAILDTDTDPERHKLYNKAMNSYCGEQCGICFPKTD